MLKENFMTKKDLIKLEKKVDKGFEEQAKIIVSAVDTVLTKRLEKIENKLTDKISQTERFLEKRM